MDAKTYLQNLSIGGKCYDSNGNELPYVIDADGVEWKTEKVSHEKITLCGIPIAANPFEGLRGWSKEVKNPNPNGEMLTLDGKYEGKWVIRRTYADWY